jgi:hypothetical protein
VQAERDHFEQLLQSLPPQSVLSLMSLPLLLCGYQKGWRLAGVA